MGGKTGGKNFPITHEYGIQKMLKKIVWKKIENTFFYKHTNIVTKKWGKKTREIIFPETHEYREQKMGGGEKREK